MIEKAKNNEKLPVYGDGKNIRDWVHVQDHCEAIDVVLHKGGPGEIYNIGGLDEKRNINIVKTILKKLSKGDELRFFKLIKLVELFSHLFSQFFDGC